MTNKGPEPGDGKAVRVLVADDDEVYLEILAETIRNAGADVKLVPDGVAALEALSVEEFDIVVSDLNMPRMDGLTLIRQVSSVYPHILIVLVTGFGSLESAIEALRLGAYDYIQKPFMVEQIAVAIRNAIEKVRMLREKAALLREIEILHKKLGLLAGKTYPVHGSNCPAVGMAAHEHGGPRPEAFLESPRGNPNRALASLENLKGLRREGVITEPELERLKQAILNSIESGRP